MVSKVARRLKVVSVSHSAVNRASGRIRYERLVELRPDIDLTLIAPDPWREYGKQMPLDPHNGPMDFRVERIRLPSLPRIGWYAHFYPRLSTLLRELRPDVIHAWEEPWSVVGMQVVRLRNKMLPQTAVLLETDQNILRKLPPPFDQIRRYNLKQIDLLIGRQDESLEVSRSCGFNGPTALVEYGVAANIFGRSDRAGAREALGVQGFVMGYVGRIVREKGLHDVLDAMSRCTTPVTLIVLGSGPDREAFEARVAELGLSERVRVLDPRPPTAVARLMNALDVLVLMSRTTASWKEQFGRVIMEAHACGVPVIGSDSGSIPGVVGQGGWIVPEGDVESLGKLIEHLTQAPAELGRAGAIGEAQAATRFSVDTVANSLADAFVTASTVRQARVPTDAG